MLGGSLSRLKIAASDGALLLAYDGYIHEMAWGYQNSVLLLSLIEAIGHSAGTTSRAPPARTTRPFGKVRIRGPMDPKSSLGGQH